MKTLEIFLWIVIFINMTNFFYVLYKAPFWNFDKQFLWKLWVLFCCSTLIVLALICYFHNINNKWITTTILLALGMNLNSIALVLSDFNKVIKDRTHFFKIERIENGRIFGELFITEKDDTFPAEMINAPQGKYKIGNKVTVNVVSCTIEKIKVEPQIS